MPTVNEDSRFNECPFLFFLLIQISSVSFWIIIFLGALFYWKKRLCNHCNMFSINKNLSLLLNLSVLLSYCWKHLYLLVSIIFWTG